MFKVQTSAGKIMASVFWDSEENLLVGFLERYATVNSVRYVETIKKLKQLSNREMNQVLLLHDNTRPHTSLLTREDIATIGWNVVPRPSVSHDLTLYTPICLAT